MLTYTAVHKIPPEMNQYDELISPRGGSVFIPHKQPLMNRQHYNSKLWWLFLEIVLQISESINGCCIS